MILELSNILEFYIKEIYYFDFTLSIHELILYH